MSNLRLPNDELEVYLQNNAQNIATSFKFKSGKRSCSLKRARQQYDRFLRALVVMGTIRDFKIYPDHYKSTTHELFMELVVVCNDQQNLYIPIVITAIKR